MTKRCCKLVCMLGFISIPVFACESLQNHTSIVMVDKEQDSVCASIVRGFDNLSSGISEVTDMIIAPIKQEDYWEEWSLQSGSDPLLSSSIESNHFGIGVWMPEEYEEKYDDMTYSERLEATGLMFSLGLGERKEDEPRMRIDYRWHNQQPGDVMLQVEVPF
ncbi:conserved hypothetical protein [Vibrio nigripulchritudo SFn27]|nr:hypothetical protein TW74_26725 [Vibrio nigripulchritudo]CCN34377.1 conserved hypothetical protein [Vibrio nigripulchritudo AM115]CCN39144.1 conserved hypothetical protein [Vibrio nigripulchritudo FTn2]CCN63171.1 conserved hypothetical protein [Vibrio nigripulchritudo POn4]CCN78325.1 conserved hypothetical protein [Vibrio nigripulchritudo SO65]CCN84418.1 conserved hypothetical protein [Vibrio nigripulchritudo BLFn1]CCN86467.1 conserved hypothetical protein [Vibrio nigripulchritudo SFn27]C